MNENRKKHVSQLNKLHIQVQELKNAKKKCEKENYDLKKTLENTRVTLKECKAERSQLRACKTKLETKVKKLKLQPQKGMKKIVTEIKPETNGENANIKSLEQVPFQDFLVQLFSPLDGVPL